MKGYKITNAALDKRIGVVGGSLKDVFKKGCQKLKINSATVTLMLTDGTVIDDEDYFQTLPPQTLLMFRSNGEQFKTGADIIYNFLTSTNTEFKNASVEVKSFINENMKERIQILHSVLEDSQNKQIDLTSCSSRNQDPEWFKDLDTRAKTKEEFMFKRCQERIRGYMYKTKTDMIKSDFYIKHSKCKQYLDEVYKKFTELLNKNKHQGHYFDRSNSNCLCDKTGTFTCQGAWNQTECAYERGTGHKINPYQNRETRIIFSTWNLDHLVERSRSVIPALFEASVMASELHCPINTEYFYRMLFTTYNLKLVHIVCHNKGQHDSAKCDPEFYLLKDEVFKINVKNDLNKIEKYQKPISTYIDL